jgi:hypothetical protein
VELTQPTYVHSIASPLFLISRLYRLLISREVSTRWLDFKKIWIKFDREITADLFFSPFVNMSRRKRQRLVTHSTEDEKEDQFMGLKTELEILTDLHELYQDDPSMQRQLFDMKQKLKTDIQSIMEQGTDLMDLYKRFGKILFKSEILNGQETLDRLT